MNKKFVFIFYFVTSELPIIVFSSYYFFNFKANLCALAAGTAFGWTSSAFLVLESNDSPLESGALSSSEIAWVGALIGIGGVAGTIVLGWLCDTIGRKKSLLFTAAPLVVRFN